MRFFSSGLPPKVLSCGLFLIAALCAGSPIASAEDGPQPSWRALSGAPFAEGRHEDVFFLDGARGWVVNLAGEVHRTTDSGVTWTRVFKSDSVRFRSVGFADSSRGWAGTLFSKTPLYETFDGGKHWIPVSGLPAAVEGICGLSVVDDSVAYAVGAYYKTSPLLKTTDRGATWTAIDLRAHAKALIDVRFHARDSGFVTGGFAGFDDPPLDSLRAVVLFTGDGGRTWETRYRSDSLGSWSWKLSFPQSRVGFATIERHRKNIGMLVKSLDGGRVWTEKKFPARSDLQGLGFADSATGWVGTHGESYFTHDGGETWSPFAFHNGLDATNRIRMLNPRLGYAVGATVFKYSVSVPGALDSRSPRALRAARAFIVSDFGPLAFRGPAEIRYRLFRPALVALDVFDGRGRRVHAGKPARLPTGNHAAKFDAGTLAPGSYLYRLRVGDEFSSGEMRVLP